MYRTLGVLALLALYVGLAQSFSWDVSAPHQVVPQKELASEGGTATLRYLFPGNPPPKITRKFPQLGVHQQRTRHKRQETGLYLFSSYIIPGGEGEGPWGKWGVVSSCSRTCGRGVTSQKRICLQSGPEGPQCTGGDTKYFPCHMQDCPDSSGDSRAEQCAEFNKSFSSLKFNWVPYSKVPNSCKLNCELHGERFYFRHNQPATDGTRCNHESFDVCVNGKCQPVVCDMMLNSTTRENKCREFRGNGATVGIFDSQDLMKGYNDILLLPAGSTSIYIEEVEPSNNHLVLRAKNGTYYLNGHYNIDFPGTIMIAGALWTYERAEQGYPAPEKLWCLGPTTEPLYLSLLLQNENVGIRYEYSVPKNSAPPTDKQYNWVHEEFTPCSATCGGGFQTRNVTCRSREELEIVDASLCDDGLRPPTNKSCSPDPCPVQWVEGPWGECSQRCGSGGVKSREVTCQKIIANGIKSAVSDKECFDLLGPKSEVFQKCNEDAPCPTWFVGHWRPCDQLCDEGKQTRQVVCHQKINGRIEVLSDGNCTEAKPEEEMPCMVRPCDGVDWVTTSWSGCDSCTSKYRTRLVVCSTRGRQVVNNSFCSYHNRPIDYEECNKDELPVCEVQWYASQWSKCSVNCGDGVQTRKVFCGMYYNDNSREGMEVVEDAKCANLTKYNDTKPCTVPKEECPSQWFTGPWSACTETCGGGEQYRRVMCYKGDEAAVCDGTTVLDPSQLCNTQPCDEFLPVSPASIVVMDEKEEYCDDEDSEEIGLSLTTDGMMSESPGAVRTKSTVFVPPKRVCKPRRLKCNETTFGCCPDQKSPSLGPFEEGCNKPHTCKNSLHGCCPDGLSPAQGENNEECPREPCADTLFGCCSSDNTTAAKGNDQDGCPLICASSKYGCCADNDIEAIGPKKKGCPETMPVSTHVLTPSPTLNIGADLNLTCEVDGSPEPDLHWTKDGGTIQTDGRITITGSTTVSRLTVMRVTVADSGLYACHASNPYSSQSDTAQINVQQLVVPAKCTDNPFLANCNHVVAGKFCKHTYYSKFCCKSCVEAGQLDPQEVEIQADQPLRKK